MKTIIPFVLVILTALFIGGCQEDSLQAPAQSATSIDAAEALKMIEAEIAAAAVAANGGEGNRNFIGVLWGGEEVPARDTDGRGVAKFQVSRDRQSISYRLIVANMSNVVGAHVHRAGAGLNGPIVVGLYSDAPGGGPINGPIATGSFTPADLVGPYAGSTDFSMFLADLHADSLYVNVHTNDGVDPADTGSGDFPGGEIRGQLKGHPGRMPPIK